MASRSFVVAALLLLPGAVPADDLTQYREPVTEVDAELRASDEELRQAVEGLREQATARSPDAWSTSTPTGAGWGTDNPLGNASPSPSPWSKAEPSRHPRPVAPPPQSADQFLLLKAFELERVAHELDMRRLFAQAKTVRRAATALRTGITGSETTTAPDSQTPATQREVRKPVAETLPLGRVAPAAPAPMRSSPPSAAPRRPPANPPANAGRSGANRSQNERSRGANEPQDRDAERSLLRRRGWLRNAPAGGYDRGSSRN